MLSRHPEPPEYPARRGDLIEQASSLASSSIQHQAECPGASECLESMPPLQPSLQYIHFSIRGRPPIYDAGGIANTEYYVIAVERR